MGLRRRRNYQSNNEAVQNQVSGCNQKKKKGPLFAQRSCPLNLPTFKQLPRVASLVNGKRHSMIMGNLSLFQYPKREGWHKQHPPVDQRCRKKWFPSKKKPSVEDIPEAPVHSEQPRNPRNILEASDGSDDDFDGLPSSATAPMQVDSDEDVVEIVEKLEEDDEAELGLYLLSFLKLSSEIFIVHMSKKWTSLVYVFYKNTPWIEYKNDRRSHIFECAASHCKGKTHDVCRYLDKGDANSTGNLLRHTKICWGSEAVEAATATKDLDAARDVLSKMKLRDGSILTEFQCIGKGKITYKHTQHTMAEARYIPLSLVLFLF
jgi:hypothetical protein